MREPTCEIREVDKGQVTQSPGPCGCGEKFGVQCECNESPVEGSEQEKDRMWFSKKNIPPAAWKPAANERQQCLFPWKDMGRADNCLGQANSSDLGRSGQIQDLFAAAGLANGLDVGGEGRGRTSMR